MLSVKSSGGLGAKAFYRYDNLLEVIKSSDNNVFSLALPEGVKWSDVEDFLICTGDYGDTTYFPVIKYNETTVRTYTSMNQYVERYKDFTIDPAGNTVTISGVGDVSKGENVGTWSRLWLRKRINAGGAENPDSGEDNSGSGTVPDDGNDTETGETITVEISYFSNRESAILTDTVTCLSSDTWQDVVDSGNNDSLTADSGGVYYNGMTLINLSTDENVLPTDTVDPNGEYVTEDTLNWMEL